MRTRTRTPTPQSDDIMSADIKRVWLRILDVDTIDFANLYVRKIKLMPDKKLAEFNFKVLQVILACGLNLNRWGKVENKLCRICKVTHDIPHLLFLLYKSYYCLEFDW